jgi:hypothetical protein
MNPDQLATAIIREASRFIGLREVRPNAEWNNPSTPGPDTALVQELRAMMRPSPWQPGWAYCAAFVEGVVVRALKEHAPKFAALFGPHCMTNVRAFRQRNLLVALPARGAIWLARHGGTDQGHAGIVTTTSDVSRIMATIEANTSLDPSTPSQEREGDWITTRMRKIDGAGSLVTQGFIHPGHIIQLITS